MLRAGLLRHRLILIPVVAAAAVVSALSVAAPAAAQSSANYVALGDSYSSGVGAGNYSDGSCDQSANAYSALWAKANDP